MKLWARHDYAERSCCDLDYQKATQMWRATHCLNMMIIDVKKL